MLPDHRRGFTDRAKAILRYASEEALKLHHEEVGTEHILLGLVHEGQGIAARALQDMGVDLERLEMEIRRMMRSSSPPIPEGIKRKPGFSRGASDAIQFAQEEAQKTQDVKAGTEHLLLGLVRERHSMAARVLAGFGVTEERVRKALRPIANSPSTPKKPRAIDQYSRDLTQLARENRLDPIIGREDEMERIMQVLIRRKKNNPVLIGEPGVGKTAIAEGLAQKIVTEDTPEPLLDKRLVTLDLAGLVAGTK